MLSNRKKDTASILMDNDVLNGNVSDGKEKGKVKGKMKVMSSTLGSVSKTMKEKSKGVVKIKDSNGITSNGKTKFSNGIHMEVEKNDKVQMNSIDKTILKQTGKVQMSSIEKKRNALQKGLVQRSEKRVKSSSLYDKLGGNSKFRQNQIQMNNLDTDDNLNLDIPVVEKKKKTILEKKKKTSILDRAVKKVSVTSPLATKTKKISGEKILDNPKKRKRKSNDITDVRTKKKRRVTEEPLKNKKRRKSSKIFEPMDDITVEPMEIPVVSTFPIETPVCAFHDFSFLQVYEPISVDESILYCDIIGEIESYNDYNNMKHLYEQKYSQLKKLKNCIDTNEHNFITLSKLSSKYPNDESILSTIDTTYNTRNNQITEYTKQLVYLSTELSKLQKNLNTFALQYFPL